MGNQSVLGLHLIFLSIILVAAKYTCPGAQNLTGTCHERERLALLKFKHSVVDDFKMLSSWVGTDCCSWKGIRCDGATRRVVSLNLRGNYLEYHYVFLGVMVNTYLVGDKVNTCLEELRHLKHLDLSGNCFQGSRIPDFIGSFKHLGYLNLANARFNGIIPHHIGNLSNLKVLDLSSSFDLNNLSTKDMAWVSRLSSLEYLDLTGVPLLHAKNIDMVLYMIPSLTYLSLGRCQLSNADIVLRINSSRILPNIKHLDLSYNDLEGQLPHFFQNLTSLKFVDLSWYNLSLAWNSVNSLNMIPSLSELHLTGCGLHNAHFSPTYFNFSAHFNIQYLDLNFNSVGGRFPYELENMTSLRVLDLSFNSLNSPIPVMSNLLKLDVSSNNLEHIELAGIWRQCHLKELSISGNHFREEMIGPSTNMSECFQYDLEMLDIHFCQLNGLIPESLGRLTKLRVLSLSFNNLQGAIPKSLERLRSLEVLNLCGNSLTGPIPTFLGKITELYLCKNQFSGSIPESLGILAGLTELSLESNRLSGPIPVSVGQLSKLYFLDISYNSLEGVVFEAHFANLSSLKYLTATSNHKLTFNISHEWIPPFQLRYVKLYSCKIVNGFPQWLQTQRKLEVLVLSNSSLHGVLPTWLRKMPVTYYLDLSQNKLGGSFGNISSSLRFLKLNDNKFNGELLGYLWNLRFLRVLDLGNNEFSGNIPTWIGNKLSALMILNLHKNNFTGKIPQSLCKFSYLHILDVAHNSLTGPIPSCFGEFTGMIKERPFSYVGESYVIRYEVQGTLNVNQVMKGIQLEYTKTSGLVYNMDLSSNKLTGQIPLEITKLIKLVGLNLSHNHLNGSIPDSIGNMKQLNSLDFSDNHFTGVIPSSMAALNFLSCLNLSQNNLSGRIPNGNQLQTLNDPSIYAGNRDLCGTPLPNNCSNHQNPPTTSNNKYKDDNEPKKVWFYFDIMCGFATGFWGVIGVLMLKKQWRYKLFMNAEIAMDKVYVAVAVRVSKIKKRKEDK